MSNAINVSSFASFSTGDAVRLVLQPATATAWIGKDDDGGLVFADAHGHAVDPAILARLVRGEEIEGRVVTAGDLLIVDTGTGEEEALALAPAYVASIARAA
jgi:hypothetical protein